MVTYKFRNVEEGLRVLEEHGFWGDKLPAMYCIFPNDMPENWPKIPGTGTAPLGIACLYENGFLSLGNGIHPVIAECHDRLRTVLDSLFLDQDQSDEVNQLESELVE